MSTEPSNSIIFSVLEQNKQVEILRLTREHFIFKGVEIHDAGEARLAFMETMRLMQIGLPSQEIPSHDPRPQ